MAKDPFVVRGTLSKKRLRKIEHIRKQYESGVDKAWLRKKALYHMKMPVEDVQAAFNGRIF